MVEGKGWQGGEKGVGVRVSRGVFGVGEGGREERRGLGWKWRVGKWLSLAILNSQN